MLALPRPFLPHGLFALLFAFEAVLQRFSFPCVLADIAGITWSFRSLRVPSFGLLYLKSYSSNARSPALRVLSRASPGSFP